MTTLEHFHFPPLPDRLGVEYARAEGYAWGRQDQAGETDPNLPIAFALAYAAHADDYEAGRLTVKVNTQSFWRFWTAARHGTLEPTDLPDNVYMALHVIPRCDTHNYGGTPAVVDGKTVHGPWANMCEECFRELGTGLGTGRGQRFILRVDGTS